MKRIMNLLNAIRSKNDFREMTLAEAIWYVVLCVSPILIGLSAFVFAIVIIVCLADFPNAPVVWMIAWETALLAALVVSVGVNLYVGYK